MIRTYLMSTVMLFAVVGCNRAADDEQKKADEARATAAKEVAAAQTDATKKMVEASQEATKKIEGATTEAALKVNEAQAGFLKLREDYRHQTNENLVALDKKIADLEAKAKTAKGKTKVQLDKGLPVIRSQREAFVSDYKNVELAAAPSWDATKARLDKEWDELKKAVDQLA